MTNKWHLETILEIQTKNCKVREGKTRRFRWKTPVSLILTLSEGLDGHVLSISLLGAKGGL